MFGDMNAVIQIELDEILQKRAEAKAAGMGISFEEYVRHVLADDLGQPSGKSDVSQIFDLGASDEPTDIARDKDKLIGEAVWQQYLRDTATTSRNGRR
jgi:hypothetical protein